MCLFCGATSSFNPSYHTQVFGDDFVALMNSLPNDFPLKGWAKVGGPGSVGDEGPAMPGAPGSLDIAVVLETYADKGENNAPQAMDTMMQILANAGKNPDAQREMQEAANDGFVFLSRAGAADAEQEAPVSVPGAKATDGGQTLATQINRALDDLLADAPSEARVADEVDLF